MKLITETTFEDISTSYRIDEETGVKQWFVEGCFAQADKKNRNGRIYKNPVLEREFKKYVNEYVNTNRALGELNHPDYPKPDPSLASHRIVEMSSTGPNFQGKALVLNTPRGQILKGLLEGGTQMGMSTRGAGNIVESVVQDDYRLFCVDSVADPSGIDCWTNGILEGREWVWQENALVEVAAQEAKDEIMKMKRITEEKLLNAFRRYIGKI